jgi:hypothetical protein
MTDNYPPRILIHHDKHDPGYWLVMSKAELIAAAMEIFNVMDSSSYYCDLTDGNCAPPAQVRLYKEALEGNGESAWKLFQLRRDYEYEWVEVAFPSRPQV